jgi:hypothetical protein
VLGEADLVGAVARANHPRGILRILAKLRHIVADPAHRPHHQEMQAEVDQGRREQRDDQGERQDTLGKGQHLVAQRCLVQHHLDPQAVVLGRSPQHTDDPHGFAPQYGEGVPDQAEEADLAKVEGRIDVVRRHVHQHELAGARLGQRHGEGLDVGQQLHGQLRAHHVIGGRLQCENGKMAGSQAFLQIVQAETRDRRRENQDFRQHDEGDGQQQQARREARRQGGKRFAFAQHGPANIARASGRWCNPDDHALGANRSSHGPLGEPRSEAIKERRRALTPRLARGNRQGDGRAECLTPPKSETGSD